MGKTKAEKDKLETHNLFAYAVRYHGWGAHPGSLLKDTWSMHNEDPLVSPLLQFYVLPPSKDLALVDKKVPSKALSAKRVREHTVFVDHMLKSVRPIFFIPVEMYLADSTGQLSSDYIDKPKTSSSACRYKTEAVIDRLKAIRNDPEILRDNTVLVHTPKMLETLIAYVKRHPFTQEERKIYEVELAKSKQKLAKKRKADLPSKKEGAAKDEKFDVSHIEAELILSDELKEKSQRIPTLTPSEVDAVLKELDEARKDQRKRTRKLQSAERKRLKRLEKEKVSQAVAEKETLKTKLVDDKNDILPSLLTLTDDELVNLPYYGDYMVFVNPEPGSDDQPRHDSMKFLRVNFITNISRLVERARIDFDEYKKVGDQDKNLFDVHYRFRRALRTTRGREDPEIVSVFRPGLDNLFALPDVPLNGKKWSYVVYPVYPIRNVARQVELLSYTSTATRRLRSHPKRAIPKSVMGPSTELVAKFFETKKFVHQAPRFLDQSKRRKRAEASLSSEASTKPVKKKSRTDSKAPTPTPGSRKPSKGTKKRSRDPKDTEVSVEKSKKRTNTDEQLAAHERFQLAHGITQDPMTLVAEADKRRVEESVDSFKARLLSSEEKPMYYQPELQPNIEKIEALYKQVSEHRDTGKKLSGSVVFESLSLIQAMKSNFNNSALVLDYARQHHDDAAHNDEDFTTTGLQYLVSDDGVAKTMQLTKRCYVSALLLDKLVSDTPTSTVTIK